MALNQQVFLPNANTTFGIALYTDSASVCSSKESEDRRCDCIKLPANIEAAAREVYGHRLIHVRAASFTNPRARIADAWSHSLRVLTRVYDVTLVLRIDSVLSAPLILTNACSQWSRRLPSQARISQQRVVAAANNGGWMGYVLCGATAAALILSFEADDDETPMVPDHLADLRLELLECPYT